jgi:hypothetical protein
MSIKWRKEKEETRNWVVETSLMESEDIYRVNQEIAHHNVSLQKSKQNYFCP